MSLFILLTLTQSFFEKIVNGFYLLTIFAQKSFERGVIQEVHHSENWIFWPFSSSCITLSFFLQHLSPPLSLTQK